MGLRRTVTTSTYEKATFGMPQRPARVDGAPWTGPEVQYLDSSDWELMLRATSYKVFPAIPSGHSNEQARMRVCTDSLLFASSARWRW